jgi:ankyrin repeat protein
MLQVLIDNKANLKVEYQNRETALLTAARRWNKQVLRLLMENRAGVHARDHFGDTVILQAAKLGRFATQDYCFKMHQLKQEMNTGGQP